ncbi:MAG TPA: phospholipase D family protein [Deltaproteobacteria bacterium]|nr:phospholipase D family protein [Deltaproteobacteria bacterium]HQI00774.1 phospholipase D family protein [Deltaproteobacteria bacterium]
MINSAFNKRIKTSMFRYSLPVVLVLYFAFQFLSSIQAHQFKATGTVDVYFSPKGGAAEAIIREIDHARKDIFIQAYSFTSAPIAKALVNAHKRGVRVEVLLDKSQRTSKYSSSDFFAHAGIPTFIDSSHAIAHSKIMIIDGSTLITGSFNFTKAAEEKNAENLLIFKGNKPLADRYIENFDEHMEHSQRYSGR